MASKRETIEGIAKASTLIAEKGALQVIEESLEQAMTYFDDNGGPGAYSWYDEVNAGLIALVEVKEKLDKAKKALELVRSLDGMGAVLIQNAGRRAS